MKSGTLDFEIINQDYILTELKEKVLRMEKTLKYLSTFCTCDKSDELCSCSTRMMNAAKKALYPGMKPTRLKKSEF